MIKHNISHSRLLRRLHTALLSQCDMSPTRAIESSYTKLPHCNIRRGSLCPRRHCEWTQHWDKKQANFIHCFIRRIGEKHCTHSGFLDECTVKEGPSALVSSSQQLHSLFNRLLPTTHDRGRESTGDSSTGGGSTRNLPGTEVTGTLKYLLVLN